MSLLLKPLPFFACLLTIIIRVTSAGAAEATPSSMDQSILNALLPAVGILSENHWVQGSLVIFITFIIASLVTWLVFKIFKSITSRTSIMLDDRIASLVHPPLYYTLVMLGISAGLALMPLSDDVHNVSLRIIRTLNIFVWLIFFIRFATLLLNRLANLTGKYDFIQHRTVTLFDNLAKIVIFSAGIYAVFVIWNIDMTAWLASAGIAGIAIGFAAKDTLSNLFSGVFIIADAPYKVGDYVVLDNIGRGKIFYEQTHPFKADTNY